MPKAGLEIGVDLKSLKAELSLASAEFRKFNENAVKSASGIRTIEQEANRAGKATGGFFKQMALANVVGNMATRAFGMVSNAIGGFLRGTIQASSSLTELNSKARVVYGESFPFIQQKTADIAKEVGRASSAILGMATDMGAVIKAFGLAGDPMERMSTQLAKLAIDMASFSNSTDEEAFTALRSGITGETEPLKRFGVVLTDANLQIFAMEKGIKKKVSAMNQAEKTVLRYNFIMEATRDAQGDAARTADTFANQSRRLKGEITELQEVLGQEATPAMATGLQVFNDFLTGVFIPAIQTVKQEVGSLLELLGMGGIVGNAIQGIRDRWNIITGNAYKITNSERQLSIDDVNAAVALKLNRPPTPEELRAFQMKQDFAAAGRNGVSAGGGGAGGQKKVSEAMEKSEKEILDSIGKQADANKKRLETERDILQVKKDMGTATKEELNELEKINRRIDFQKDAVDEATDAWKEQTRVVEDLREELRKLNEEPLKLRQELDKTLADIDRETAKKKGDKLTDLIKERNDLQKKMGDLSGDERVNAQNRLSQIDSLIDPFRNTAEGKAALQSAESTAGMNDLQLIDKEAEDKKREAARENAAALEEAVVKITEKQIALQDAQVVLKQKVDDVTKAVAEQAVKNEASFAMIESATKVHVDAEVAKWKELEQQLIAVSTAYGNAGGLPAAAVPAAAFASGGPVSGPGTGTSDSVVARLSSGEHVLTASDVRAMGGQSAVMAFRELLHQMPRFADGGPVNNSRKVVQNFYHSSSSSPLMIAWHTRRAIR